MSAVVTDLSTPSFLICIIASNISNESDPPKYKEASELDGPLLLRPWKSTTSSEYLA